MDAHAGRYGAAVLTDTLTPKQEAFALAYVETGNAAEAYRRAYDVKAATTHSSIYVAASRLLDNPKVALRIEAIQKQAAELCMYTVRDAFQEYEQARQLAVQIGNPSAAVSAITGKVKLFGLDQPSKIDHTSSDGSMTPKPAIDLTKAPPELLAWIVTQNDASEQE
jgi:phage terminase small subunit